jgi:hypothetical protein
MRDDDLPPDDLPPDDAPPDDAPLGETPRDELFSAYLDGELTADEQAEIEHLLATDSAGRRLLDDLQSLSQTLQSLPRETLGEDLRNEVLRVAERRLLTEGGPGEETQPKSLVHWLSKRFLQRRALTWAGLAVAIALMITMTERWQGTGPHTPAVREMARSPAAADRPAPRELAPGAPAPKKTGLPPTIRAAGEASLTTDGDRQGGLAGGAARKAETTAASSVEKGSLDKARAKEGALQESSTALGGDDAPAVVVQCVVHQEADTHTLEKLLDANGIAWQPPARRELALRSIRGRTKAEEAGKDVQPSPRSAAAALGSAPLKAGEYDADRVYEVEATPPQLQAILAGLAAQPKRFVSFSLQPPYAEPLRGDASQLLADQKSALESAHGGDLFQFRQRMQFSGPEGNRSISGQLDVIEREASPPLSLDQTIGRRKVVFLVQIAPGNASSATVKGGEKANSLQPAANPASPHPSGSN